MGLFWCDVRPLKVAYYPLHGDLVRFHVASVSLLTTFLTHDIATRVIRLSTSPWMKNRGFFAFQIY